MHGAGDKDGKDKEGTGAKSGGGSKQDEGLKTASDDKPDGKGAFSPSLRKQNEKKESSFSPKFTGEDKKEKSFNPSLEMSKEKKKQFKPKLAADTKEKDRKFSPILKPEHLEKTQRSFKPSLKNLSKENVANSLISNISPKFIEYTNYTKKIGIDKFPNQYPNRGIRITDKFKNWIEKVHFLNDPSKKQNLLNQVDKINKEKHIQDMIKNEILHTGKSLKAISRYFKEYGLNLSPHTIKGIALNQVYKDNLNKYNERFPSGTGGFLQENYSLDKRSIAFDNIELLKDKFIQYHEYAIKNELRISYANRGAKITSQFIKWVRENEKNLNVRDQLINAARAITKNGEIPQYVMDKTINSTSSMRTISEGLKKKGIYLSHHAIGNYARDHVLESKAEKIERFPSATEMYSKETYDKIRKEVRKYYPIPQRWISKKLGVTRAVIQRVAKLENTKVEYERKWPAYDKISEEIRNSVIIDVNNTNLNISQIGDKFGISPHTVRHIAKEDVFKANEKSFEDRFPSNDYRLLGVSTHYCILDELTCYFNKNCNERFFAEPRIYPGNNKGCDGLILNDENFLQNQLKNGELSNLIHGIPANSIDSKFDHIKAIQIDLTNDITDQNIINKCNKYERPDLMLYIVGTNWYPYELIKRIPNDNSILYPENAKIISHELLADFIGLQGKERERYENIIDLNYDGDIDSLKRIHNENKINWYHKNDLRKELKQKRLIKRFVNEYFKIPYKKKKVQKSLF